MTSANSKTVHTAPSPVAPSDPTFGRFTRRFSDRTVDRAIRVLAILLPIGLLAFGAFYWLDRHPQAGPPLRDRQVTAAEQAVRDSPNDLAVRNYLAAAYVDAGRLDDGIAQFTLVLEAGPGNRPALLGRGIAYMDQEDYDAAVADFQALVDVSQGEFSATDPQLEQAYYELGVAELARGHAAEAVAAEEAALRINGGDADALYTFGTALIQTGDPTKGVAALRRAVQYVPGGWCEPYQGLVTGYSALGDADGTSYASAMVALCQGSVDEARETLQTLTGGPMKIDALLGLAAVAEQASAPAEAAATYRQVLEIDPGNTSALIGLSQLGPLATPEGS
jgi:tetratricopeptide (TPR) repeat protein